MGTGQDWSASDSVGHSCSYACRPTKGGVVMEVSGESDRKDATTPTEVSTRPTRQAGSWSLTLLAPLLVLATPLYNSAAFRLWGFALFYWLPVLFIPVSVICAALVYQKAKDINPAGELDTAPGA